MIDQVQKELTQRQLVDLWKSLRLVLQLSCSSYSANVFNRMPRLSLTESNADGKRETLTQFPAVLSKFDLSNTVTMNPTRGKASQQLDHAIATLVQEARLIAS